MQNVKYCLLIGALVGLTACGGGGGGGGGGASSATLGTPAPTATAASVSTLNAFRGSGDIPSSFREVTPLAIAPLQAAAAGLPSGAGLINYLKVTFNDPVTGEATLLSLGRYQDRVPLRVQVPAGVTQIQFEIYNSAGSVSGQWSLS
ncbi:hypothetical protein NT239_01980 [Chitinibacter sp. SCUT-21]|uniref:hypothetical protein n=1 Tax=Chitinibacter sp. SCUT-21 TaxID=2970891 RepID=UPI0035A576AD